MGDRTAIEWTDATWNPIHGKRGYWTCVKISPGCAHCYAERINMRRGFPAYRVGADEPTLYEPALTIPLGWKKPRRVFVCSMTDLFHDGIPYDWLDRIFAVMAAAYRHTFQVLTKRPERMRVYLSGLTSERITRYGCVAELPLPNVWLGVSVENQWYADARIPELLRTPAAGRFVSAEPLLGPLNLSPWLCCSACADTWDGTRPPPGTDVLAHCQNPRLGWLIVGGESGGLPARALVMSGAFDDPGPWIPKPHALTWVRALRDQCQAAGVAFFHKQWGGPRPTSGGRELDGRTWEEFPQTEVR